MPPVPSASLNIRFVDHLPANIKVFALGPPLCVLVNRPWWDTVSPRERAATLRQFVGLEGPGRGHAWAFCRRESMSLLIEAHAQFTTWAGKVGVES